MTLGLGVRGLGFRISGGSQRFPRVVSVCLTVEALI